MTKLRIEGVEIEIESERKETPKDDSGGAVIWFIFALVLIGLALRFG